MAYLFAKADPIAVWSLVVAVASFLVAVIAGGAAIRAIKLR
jgi:hypothetical protein